MPEQDWLYWHIVNGEVLRESGLPTRLITPRELELIGWAVLVSTQQLIIATKDYVVLIEIPRA